MRSQRRGFTLMELMVVVTILALTFALILPMADSATPGYRLKAGVRQVGAMAEFVHSEAVASRRPFAIVYDFESRSFFTIIPVERPLEDNPDQMQWVLEENNPEAYTDPEELPQGVYFMSVQTADGQQYQGGQRIIRFDAGSTRGSHIVTLGVQDGDGALNLPPWSMKYNTMTRSLVYAEAQQTFFRE